jgi:lysophospholipase L1-like esterase
MKPALFLLALPGLLAPALSAAVIPANDPQLRYTGHFDTTGQYAATPSATWTGSSVSLTIDGGSASVRLGETTGKNHWQVIINGQPTTVLALEPGEKDYPLAGNLPPGRHTIELFKRTEASQGLTQILSFTIDDNARLLPTPARARRIEVIGDSISCGYGNEAAGKEEKYTPATENGWLAYGAVAARAVEADYTCIAQAGKRLWPGNSIIDLYHRAVPDTSSAKRDSLSPPAPPPDAVVINLGTNEFNDKQNPDETGWIAAYLDFIRQLRARYPEAVIYCAVGPMLSNWPGDRKPRATILGYLAKVVEQANTAGIHPPVRLLDFGTQYQHHGIGASWHPGVKTHSLMAEKLTAALRRDLGW